MWMPLESVVPKSGQAWKVVSWLVGILGAGAVLLWGFQSSTDVGSMVGVLGGALLGLVSLAAMCLSVRCNHCGARWVWMAISTQKVFQWWTWLMSQTVCPKCGNAPDGQVET